MAGGIGSSDRVALATIEEWSKMVSEETEKYLVLMALLKKKGRISTGHSGGQMRWVVRIADHKLQGFPDMTPVSFTRKNTIENATLPWRGYYVQDTITLREKLEQGGAEAMIKVFAGREEVMRRGAIRDLSDKFFVDGNAAGNENDFHGIESFMGIGAQTGSDIDATTHNDTYAGLGTVEQGVGGADQPRLWTPTIINTDYTPSGGSQKPWSSFGDEYIRTALLRTTFGNGPDDKPDLIMLNRNAYEQLLNLLDDKERIPVSRGADLGLTKLGFGNHIQIDGCSVMWDASVPTTDSDSATVRGYGFTTSRLKLKVLGDASKKGLFKVKVSFNDAYRADNIFMHLLGNLCFESPRHFIKLADISSVAS